MLYSRCDGQGRIRFDCRVSTHLRVYEKLLYVNLVLMPTVSCELHVRTPYRRAGSDLPSNRFSVNAPPEPALQPQTELALL